VLSRRRISERFSSPTATYVDESSTNYNEEAAAGGVARQILGVCCDSGFVQSDAVL
jgi:hypothetical protein